ncbi:IS66 family insertion sequence element accessory protein TnpB [Caulobacter sp. KR2-114]|uniref:IS66 family insertion sequence element accessory protein TnpB n=1 Tax=Caulobacter sp. KR2-114 TaxID=3400912 RepID=UPI003C0F6B0B
MIPVPSDVRIWIATGQTDMRKGMNGLARLIQEHLRRDPHVGDVYVFRGWRGDLRKIVWHDGVGLSPYAKRLDRGQFVWPPTVSGAVALTAGQLGYMLEGIDWRNLRRTSAPAVGTPSPRYSPDGYIQTLNCPVDSYQHGPQRPGANRASRGGG